jgi:hypothetical protein
MNETQSAKEGESGGLASEARMSALFAGLVVNQAQMAFMLMGRMPHPETGQTVKEIDGARMFIDQLEMLEHKTRGNLDERERKLLRDNLTALHLAFVEAVGDGAEPQASSADRLDKEKPGGAAKDVSTGGLDASGSVGESDSRKKFSKKY